jgi:ABC-type sugar transport system ATPase subunit
MAGDHPESTPQPARGVSAVGIEKAFGGTQVLRGVTVEVPKGHFAVLVGPSGCGKSTLLRLLAGLEEVDRGTLTIGERDVTRLPPRERDIAMVFQSYALYPHMTVRENMAFGLELRKVARAETERRVAEAAGVLGLEKLLDRLPKQLSGGQRQRVAMGRAIVRQAELFLFDEPLSNLDAALRSQVRVEIRRIHDRMGATSVYVTHDQVEAMTLADVIFVLNRGVVEQSGPPLEVYGEPATKFVAGFLGSPSMNFVPAAIAEEGGELVASAAGLRVPLDRARFGAVRAGAGATLGVRPQEVREARDGEVAHAAGTVSLVEALGSETFVHVQASDAGGAPLVVRLPPERPVRRGERLSLVAERVHLFDPETGRSLSLRAPEEGR